MNLLLQHPIPAIREKEDITFLAILFAILTVLMVGYMLLMSAASKTITAPQTEQLEVAADIYV